jgi:nucleotide-binding universal stress UspA family protein
MASQQSRPNGQTIALEVFETARKRASKGHHTMFTIGKILLPIDFSARSADAADAAMAVAAHFGSEIVLLHVLARHFELPLTTSAQTKVLNSGVRIEAEENMKEFRPNQWGHLHVKRALREGDPARTIVEYATEEHIDLIMMPTHGYGPFRRLLLGSITAKVLHDAKCPVWTAVHTTDVSSTASAMPRRIACAVNLGSQSGSVLSWASRLCWEFGARLSAIHVVSSLDPRLEDYYLSPEWRGDVLKNAGAELQQLMETAGTDGEIHIEIGPVADAVAEAAKRVQADLLVIGRDGRAGGRLPTNAYAIVRESPCPVLSV